MNALAPMATAIREAIAHPQPPLVAHPAAPAPHRHALFRCIADVKRERLEWLWPARIPLGKVSMLAGDPGLGKSVFTTTMAAIVSNGAAWPIHGDGRAPAGDVVIVSAEDDVADTIRGRLEAIGANLQRITILDGVSDIDPDGNPYRRPWTLGDLPELEELLDHLLGCRLLVIDPISSYLAGTDSHKNADVRALLMPLSELAARRRLAIVVVSHLNKSQGPAAYRVTGSLAFTAAARAAYCVAKDKENPARRIVVPLKTNLAPDANERAGIAYTVEGDATGAARLVFEPEPFAVDANEALAIPTGDSDERSEAHDAAEWLRDRLADGSPVPVKVIKRDGDDAGHSWRTLQRVMRTVGIESVRNGFGQGATWELPIRASRANLPRSEILGANGTFGANGQPCGFQGIEKDEFLHSRHSRQGIGTGANGINGVPETGQDQKVDGGDGRIVL